jgi:hypothetical protein
LFSARFSINIIFSGEQLSENIDTDVSWLSGNVDKVKIGLLAAGADLEATAQSWHSYQTLLKELTNWISDAEDSSQLPLKEQQVN